MIKVIAVILLAYTITVPVLHPLKTYCRKPLSSEISYGEVLAAPILVPFVLLLLGVNSFGNCAIGCK